jgi:uncharacterized protein YuzE
MTGDLSQKIKFIGDTKTLYIEFRDDRALEIKPLDKDIPVGGDADGEMCGMTVKHAHKRADVKKICYEHIPASRPAAAGDQSAHLGHLLLGRGYRGVAGGPADLWVLSMIEAKNILALCGRSEAYLVPLDIRALRRRYNGQTYQSTYPLANAMGISDEPVRTIEARALAMPPVCRNLEEVGQAITPMRLPKAFRQKIGSRMCAGCERVMPAATHTAHRGESLVCASSLNPEHSIEDQSVGVVVGWALLVGCDRESPFPSMGAPL